MKSTLLFLATLLVATGILVCTHEDITVTVSLENELKGLRHLKKTRELQEEEHPLLTFQNEDREMQGLIDLIFNIINFIFFRTICRESGNGAQYQTVTISVFSSIGSFFNPNESFGACGECAALCNNRPRIDDSFCIDAFFSSEDNTCFCSVLADLCGVNTECVLGNICTCLDGFEGNPYVGCCQDGFERSPVGCPFLTTTTTSTTTTAPTGTANNPTSMTASTSITGST